MATADGAGSPGLLRPGDPALDGLVARFDRLAVDAGCGDGKYALRLAERDPQRLVIGVDAETGRLDRTLVTARKRRLANLAFVGWPLDRPLEPLAGRASEVHAIMPWGSLLDGVLGGDEAVLDAVLGLGAPGAQFASVVNCRPWDAPASVDRKLASTPVPTPEVLAALREQYAARGWALGEPEQLDDAAARAVGSSWTSRVVASRQAMLLRLRARRG